MLEIADVLQKEISIEWTGREYHLPVTLLGCENVLKDLPNAVFNLENSYIPLTREDAENFVRKNDNNYYEDNKLKGALLVRYAKTTFGHLMIIASGESYKNVGTSYNDKASAFSLKILKGHKLKNKDIGYPVHEVGEAIGEISYDSGHFIEKPNKREIEIRKSMLNKIETLFPEYYST